MKRRTVLIVLLLLLYSLLGTVTILSDDRSPFVLLHSIWLFFCAGAFLFGNLYNLLPYFRKLEIGRIIMLNLGFLVPAYFIGAYLSSTWMAEISHYPVKASHLIHPASIRENLPYLLTLMGISIIAAYLKHLFLSKNYRLLRNMALYSTLFLFMISIGAYINYRIDTKYEGTAQIQFIEEKHSNLEEILQLPQFKGKVVYVDLWFSSCGPCLEEFKYAAYLKNKLAGKNVAFLYLGKETSHPNSIQRWKNAIKEHNLQGWHFYMSNAMATNLWEEIMAKQEDKGAPASYPRYLLIDPNGQIISYQAKRPSEQEATVRQIETALQSPMARNRQPN